MYFEVSASDAVLFTAREKEKAYTTDQEDPEVVQPYAAYGPAGHPKVNLFTASQHLQKNRCQADNVFSETILCETVSSSYLSLRCNLVKAT